MATPVGELSCPPGRLLLLGHVADAVQAAAGGTGVVRVGIDGVDGAGKTTFADELAALLSARGRCVIRASVDGFHSPPEVRYRRGRSAPDGFWQDSYDYRRFAAELLDPLGPGGSRRFRRAVYDVEAERPVDSPQEEAPDTAVLVVDGIFLHRDELVRHWDYSIFLEVDTAVAVRRCAQRDGGSSNPSAAANRRYVEGQRLYLAACEPRLRADLVIDNTDLACPVMMSARAPGPSGEGAVATVVVVTFQGARWLPGCLDAIAAQRLREGATPPCWVVDNGSRDGTAGLLRERKAGIRVITSPRNLGFAGGNNLALREVTTPYAVLVNDDAMLQPGALAALLAPMTAAGGDRVAAVAAKVLLLPRFIRIPLRLDPAAGPLGLSRVVRDGADVTGDVVWDPLLARGADDGPVHWCRPVVDLLVPVPAARPVLATPVKVDLEVRARGAGVLELGTGPAAVRVVVGPAPAQVGLTLPVGTGTVDVVNSAGTTVSRTGYAADRGYGEADEGRFDVEEEVFTGSGAALALRTAALRDVGLFDDDWFLYYEDVDLCWRLRRRGWTVRYSPAAVVRHRHSATVGTRSDLHVFHDHRNRLLTLTKNASAPVIVRGVGRYPATTASMTVRALRHAVSGGGTAALRGPLLRLRVLASYVRLLPRVLVARRAIEADATVGRRVVESWLGRRAAAPG